MPILQRWKFYMYLVVDINLTSRINSDLLVSKNFTIWYALSKEAGDHIVDFLNMIKWPHNDRLL